jgi:hypothetical protein
MDHLPIVRPRTPTGPLGYLNFPPEIMNQIYREVFVDNSQILAFLCSSDSTFQFLSLKQAVAAHQSPRHDQLDWTQLYDVRYYTNSIGLSAQFLRVCRKVWSEGSPVLYGNITVAVRFTPVRLDPCLPRFFKRNTPYVLARAHFVYPRFAEPVNCLMHWGITHTIREADTREGTLEELRANGKEMQRCRNMRKGSASF